MQKRRLEIGTAAGFADRRLPSPGLLDVPRLYRPEGVTRLNRLRLCIHFSESGHFFRIWTV